MRYLYSEDRILKLKNVLNSLKGMILMDDNDELFLFKDFYIESVTTTKGFFKKREVTEFYVKWITITDGTNEYFHDEDDMCSAYGIRILLGYHKNWTALQAKLVKFTVATGMPLNFSMINNDPEV